MQILDAADRLVAQSDSPPQKGARPTSGILPQEVLTDEHTLPGATDLKPGRYILIAGLYEPTTGRRLPTPDGATFVRLAELEVPATTETGEQ